MVDGLRGGWPETPGSHGVRGAAQLAMGYYVRSDRNPHPSFLGGWGLSILPDMMPLCGQLVNRFFYKICSFYIEKRYFLEGFHRATLRKIAFFEELAAGQLFEKYAYFAQ